MGEDLVRRLREGATWDDDIEAANLIEELEANIDLKADFIDATMNQLAASEQRISELESKLAKAVEALREVTQTLVWQCFGSCRGYSDNLLTSKEAEEVARATLAELKG